MAAPVKHLSETNKKWNKVKERGSNFTKKEFGVKGKPYCVLFPSFARTSLRSVGFHVEWVTVKNVVPRLWGTGVS